MTTPDFPEGFRGAGPMFAAVDLGDPWYNLAKMGEVTYVAENADVPGRSAFLDRADAEVAADASTGGEFTHWTGLSGWSEVTPARAEAERLAEADWDAWARQEGPPVEADWEREWDSADSNRYQARVEAEPEAGS